MSVAVAVRQFLHETALDVRTYDLPVLSALFHQIPAAFRASFAGWAAPRHKPAFRVMLASIIPAPFPRLFYLYAPPAYGALHSRVLKEGFGIAAVRKARAR